MYPVTIYRLVDFAFKWLFCIGILLSQTFHYSQAALERMHAPHTSPPPQQLILAIESNDVQKAAALIRDRQNINDTDFFGYSPLHYAVKRGKVPIVSLLIKAKVLLNQVSTQHGNTPLLLAIETGHKKITSLLLTAGADTTIKNHLGYNALHLAIQHKREDLVQLLLEAAAPYNSCTPEGYTPLLLAIQAGSIPMVQQLVKCNNIIDCQDQNGYNALHWAIKKQAKAIFTILVQSGKFNVQAVSQKGETPLHLIAANRNIHPSFLKQLLSVSVLQVNATDAAGSTPLHYAAAANHFKAVQGLVRHANIQVNQQNHAGQTALHYAVANNHVAMVKQLLTRVDSAVSLANKKGITPIEWAMRHKYTKIYRLLLAHISFIESEEMVDTDSYAQ
ncbi:MAG: ankyrin repeat domain-containing protein [Candidatus Cardinium sp.]|nr:ankyrin repeat domain-containing protein [Candidatus Cardinium sp.]